MILLGWISWLLLFVAALLVLILVGQYFYRNASPWRRIYFPVMNRYAFLAGMHLQEADLVGDKFHPRRPLRALLKELWPQVSETQVDLALMKWESEFLLGVAHQPFFVELLSELNPGQDSIARIPILQAEFARQQPGMLVRYVVGEIIEGQVGAAQKKRYWKAILRNQVP